MNFIGKSSVNVSRGEIEFSKDFDGFIKLTFGTNVSFIKPSELAFIKQKYKNVIRSVNNLKPSLIYDMKALASYIHDISWGWVREKTLDLSLKYDIFLQICKPVKPEWTALHDKLHGDFEYDSFRNKPTKEQIEKISPLLHEIELIFQQYEHTPIDSSLLVGSSQGTKGCTTIKDYIDEQVKKINAKESVFIKRIKEFTDSLHVVLKDKIEISGKFDNFAKWMFQDDEGLMKQGGLYNIVKERYEKLLGVVNSFVELSDFKIVANGFQFCILSDFNKLQQIKIKKLGNNLVYLDIEEPDHKAKDSVGTQLQNCSADLPINEESKKADSECSQAVQIDELSEGDTNLKTNPLDEQKNKETQQGVDELADSATRLNMQQSVDELADSAASLKTKQPSKAILDQSIEEVFNIYVSVWESYALFIRFTKDALLKIKKDKTKISEDFDGFMQLIFKDSVGFINSGKLASIEPKYTKFMQGVNNLKPSSRDDWEMLADGVMGIPYEWLKKKIDNVMFEYYLFLSNSADVSSERITLRSKLYDAFGDGKLESKYIRKKVERTLGLFKEVELILQQRRNIFAKSPWGVEYYATITDFVNAQEDKISTDVNALKQRQIDFKNSMFRAWLQKTEDGISIPEKFDDFVKSMFQDDLKLIKQDDLNKVKQQYECIIRRINNTKSFQSFGNVLVALQIYVLEVFKKLQKIKYEDICDNLMFLDIEDSDHKAKDSVDEQLQNCSADLPIKEESKKADPECSQVVQIDELLAEEHVHCEPSTNIESSQEELLSPNNKACSL